jgi:hypothetical protein
MPTPTPIAATSLSRTPTADPAGSAADAVNGNTVPNSGSTLIRVKNTDTNPHNVTFVAPGQVDGLDIADDGPHSIAASTTDWFSGYDPDVFGRVMKITCDSATLLLTVLEPG